MLAPWNRGNRQLPPSSRPLSTLSLRQWPAGLRLPAWLLATILGTAAAAGVGCDNPTSIANKTVRDETGRVSSLPGGKKADDAAVASGASTAIVNGGDPAKASAAQQTQIAGVRDTLPVLSKVEKADPQSIADWQIRQRELNVTQRDAIVSGMLAARQSQRDAARTALEKLVATPDATAEVKVDPLLRMTQLDLSSGDHYWLAAAEKSAQAADLANEIDWLLSYVRRNNERIADLQAREPKKSLDALTNLENSIKGSSATALALRDPAGGFKGEWTFGASGASAPSEKQITATLEALEKDRQAAVDAKAAAEAKAKDLLTQSRDLQNKAETENGEAALADALKAADLKSQASAEQIKADQAQATITEKGQDIEIVKTRSPVNTAALASVDAQRKLVNARWDEVKKQIEDLKAENTRVMGTVVDPKDAPPYVRPLVVRTAAPAATRPAAAAGARTPAAPTPPPSNTTIPDAAPQITKDSLIGLRVAQMRAAINQAEALRVQAETYYKQAAKDNDDARAAAKAATDAINERKSSLSTEVQNAEGNPFDLRLNLLNEKQFDFRDALLLQRQARVASDRLVDMLVSAAINSRAQEILPVANLPTTGFEGLLLPTSDKLGTQAKAADDLYDAAMKKLGSGGNAGGEGSSNSENTAGGGTGGGEGKAGDVPVEKSVKNASVGLLANIEYSRSRLQKLMNLKDAQTLLENAIRDASTYAAANNKTAPQGTPPEVTQALISKGAIPAPIMPTATTQPAAPASQPTTAPTTPEGAPVTPPATTTEGAPVAPPAPTSPPAAPEGATPPATTPATPPAAPEGTTPTTPPAAPPAEGAPTPPPAPAPAAPTETPPAAPPAPAPGGETPAPPPAPTPAPPPAV